jgi:hypothetical protein
VRDAALLLVALAVAAPAAAQERDYCPARPGLGTPACTIAPGRVSVETSVADWERDDKADQRSDTILFGDTIVRAGLTDTIEGIVGWSPVGIARERDKATGSIDRTTAVGDAYLGLKANLANPDGSGFSVAVQPFATLPVGRSPIGAGDWGAGLLVPMSYDLPGGMNLQFTPEIDAAVDDDGDGRHLAYSAVAGIELPFTKTVSATAEVQALRDRDPGGRTSQAFAALSVAWMANDDLQLDIGGVAGLNHDAADARVYAGVSRRF